MSQNVFADEWHDCLKAHYIHVIQTNDSVTLPSLTIVMEQAGFSASELAEMRVLATMHVDQAGADFVPDLKALEKTSAPGNGQFVSLPPVTVVMPAEELPEMIESEAEDVEEAPDDLELLIGDMPEDEDPDSGEQLSLF